MFHKEPRLCVLKKKSGICSFAYKNAIQAILLPYFYIKIGNRINLDDSSSPYPIFIVVIIQRVITSLHICLTTTCVSCLRAFSSVYISPHLALSSELVTVFRKHVCVHVCLWLSMCVLECGKGEYKKKTLECGLNDEIVSKYYSFIFLSSNYRKSLSYV